ncbi:N-acetyltransferase family protein [Salipaludibacillus sp. CF4.18]|uniref:GNAT family N-acetyltransferase n=1 Tax=Salipaludibacillus sp. CF4.18 TaxID=3373081 RepID=UPI003EE74619
MMKISQTNDYELVAELNKHVHVLHANLYPQYFMPYNYKAIKETFKNVFQIPNYTFLLLEDNDEAVGYAWIEMRNYPENVFVKGYRSIYVHQISIAETKQNKGYGSRLMEKIYDIAKSKGIHLVELEYWYDNDAAKEFYEKHNFTNYREFVNKRLPER